ncbi:MAG: hypothetical protein Tp172MES00d2C118482111_28 [Prokaryotic dsDNA virus sp.]|nr:MAG: hypothetical protein Tp172MES00d2C118482111_28 [Prokaryotic dsDNA virus sp.]
MDQKIYAYPGGEHRFIDGKYDGFYYANGRKMDPAGPPFNEWDEWTLERETQLLSLGFKLK